ncbi:MAG: hypothetical protein AAFR84_03050 [Pseudomonadota bacterium]
MSRTYAEQLRDGIGYRATPVQSDVLRGAAAALDAQDQELRRLRDGLEAVRVYGSDTLSGPSGPSPADREWYRKGVRKMVAQARRVLAGDDWYDDAED